jgi:hypothetical protein
VSKVSKFKNLAAKKSQEEPQGKAAKQMLFHDNNSVHVSKNDDINANVNSDASVNASVLAHENTNANDYVHTEANVNAIEHEDENINDDVDVSVHTDNNVHDHVHVDGYVIDDVNTSVEVHENVHVSDYENEDVAENVNVDINAIVYGNVDVKVISKKIKSRKAKKEPFEERYTRRTLWIHKDLNELLDLELENGGNITEVVNDALKFYYNMKARGLIDDGR